MYISNNLIHYAVIVSMFVLLFVCMWSSVPYKYKAFSEQLCEKVCSPGRGLVVDFECVCLNRIGFESLHTDEQDY